MTKRVSPATSCTAECETAAAAVTLIRRTGAELVGAGFLVELSFLPGRDRLHGFPVHALVDFGSEG